MKFLLEARYMLQHPTQQANINPQRESTIPNRFSIPVFWSMSRRLRSYKLFAAQGGLKKRRSLFFSIMFCSLMHISSLFYIEQTTNSKTFSNIFSRQVPNHHQQTINKLGAQPESL